MLKFFRNIRKKLAAENKVASYLRYAIGEILLVVIGILIALQINNWNENRKLLINEEHLYKKLITDLISEEKGIKSQIYYLKLHQDLHYNIFEQTKGKYKGDSTISYNRLQWIIIYHPIIKENYASILDKITDDGIRDFVSRYISRENSTMDANVELNEYKIQYLRPYFSENGILNTESAFNETRYEFMSLDKVELINRKKLEEQYGLKEMDQILFNLRFKTSWMIHNFNRLEEQNNKLRLALENELGMEESR